LQTILCGFDTAVCLQAMCAWDPSKRPTASQALQHPFFQVGMCISPPVSQHELAQPKGYSSAVLDAKGPLGLEIQRRAVGGETPVEPLVGLPTSEKYSNLFSGIGQGKANGQMKQVNTVSSFFACVQKGVYLHK
jgi:protein kinase